MSTLADLRARLRQDLHDQDPAAYRWPDAALDRHLARALRELSLALPLSATAEVVAPGNSRDLSLASLPDLPSLLEVEAVEYPADAYPPCYVRFRAWGQTLGLLVPEAPPAGASLRLYYGRTHSLDDAGSTLPEALEELLLSGAVGYAALEWAGYAIDRQNSGGADVWLHYFTWGQDRLAAFARGLSQRSRGLRARQFYTSAAPASRASDAGP